MEFAYERYTHYFVASTGYETNSSTVLHQVVVPPQTANPGTRQCPSGRPRKLRIATHSDAW